MLYPTELRAHGKHAILPYSSHAAEPMSQNPFVWQIQVRREVLDEEMSRLREIPYSLWLDVMAHPISKVVKGRDNKAYRVRVTAAYAPDSSDDIRVTLSLARATFIRRGLMRQTFVITKENTFRV
jgi:hypothetical protein